MDTHTSHYARHSPTLNMNYQWDYATPQSPKNVVNHYNDVEALDIFARLVR